MKLENSRTNFYAAIKEIKSQFKNPLFSLQTEDYFDTVYSVATITVIRQNEQYYAMIEEDNSGMFADCVSMDAEDIANYITDHIYINAHPPLEEILTIPSDILSFAVEDIYDAYDLEGKDLSKLPDDIVSKFVELKMGV